MPAFAKPGLIHRNPPVQVGEGTCQVQRRQPVLIRYQIREVSGSRRTGATLLFLADPKPLPTNSSPLKKKKKKSNFISCTRSPEHTHLSCHSLRNHQLRRRFPAGHVAALLWQIAVLLIFCQQWTLWHNITGLRLLWRVRKRPSKRLLLLLTNLNSVKLCEAAHNQPNESNILKPQFFLNSSAASVSCEIRE